MGMLLVRVAVRYRFRISLRSKTEWALVKFVHIGTQKFTVSSSLDMPLTTSETPLTFTIFERCKTTKARVSKMKLIHYNVDMPVFMPVGTQGTLKGLLSQQLEQLNCQIILANTYHLGNRPGIDTLMAAGGLHKFMNWNRALLTDSGGFQMVSLLKLSKVTEAGVEFQSPYDDTKSMLTPEHSIHIQNVIGADIIMQLDDVVKSTLTGPRVEEAMQRTTRWLDRCLSAHNRPDKQSIFPIVQGGLDENLRSKSAHQLIQRNVNGYAIGGLSGGESKDDFWKMVDLSTNILPEDKPRYLMGVGFAMDIIVCCALGVDMFDCVFPTRTARFGCALVKSGQLNLRQAKYTTDPRPIDEESYAKYQRKYLEAKVSRIYTRLYVMFVSS
ncbi:hypothetical protein KM043_011774 [Ampulex compressa]|nr:hypothetical protein KM043_011774 [Ampulex compressa]